MKTSPSSSQARLEAGRAAETAKTKSRAARRVVKSPPRRLPKLPASIGLLPEHCPNSEAHKVDFEYFNPAAREVFVAGSFNSWQARGTPMTKERGGKWSAEVLLQPGHYEYRLVVDGQWQDDPMATRFVTNPFGGLNCVREVSSSRGRMD